VGSNGEDDDALMVQCGRGEAGAFDELFHRYRQPLWAYFRRRIADAARAEDLTQEAFLALLTGAARYQPRGSFRSYLFSIAFNLASAERRRAARMPGGNGSPDTAPARTAPPDTVLWVRSALAALDEMDREVVLLREFEALSYEEIAAVLQTPVGTVRSRLFRAREALRRRLVPDQAAPVQGERQ
jgi:RNA polymerase sigma-70 factor (ECF subfamily)